jgi:hypothetical protein
MAMLKNLFKGLKKSKEEANNGGGEEIQDQTEVNNVRFHIFLDVMLFSVIAIGRIKQEEPLF